jgi:hypothetical protein
VPLAGLGLVTWAVYLMVTVRLPWWRYGGSLRSWSQLLGEGRGAFAACLAGVGVVMAAYIWGWRVVRRGTTAGPVGRPVLWPLCLRTGQAGTGHRTHLGLCWPVCRDSVLAHAHYF